MRKTKAQIEAWKKKEHETIVDAVHAANADLSRQRVERIVNLVEYLQKGITTKQRTQ